MRRAVLHQHHGNHQPADALLATLAAARRGLHISRRLQRKARHRVAKSIIVPPAQFLVEVFDREVRVSLLVETSHQVQFAFRGTPVGKLFRAACRAGPRRPQPRNARTDGGSGGPTNLEDRPLLPLSDDPSYIAHARPGNASRAPPNPMTDHAQAPEQPVNKPDKSRAPNRGQLMRSLHADSATLALRSTPCFFRIFAIVNPRQ
jgi:hypothetical protein